MDLILVKALIGLTLLMTLVITLYGDKLDKVITYKRTNISKILLLIIYLVLIGYSIGLAVFIPNLILLIFILWGIIFAISANRKYLYGSAIVILALCPILLIFNHEGFAEYFAVLAFLLLCSGIAKDLLYNKLYEN